MLMMSNSLCPDQLPTFFIMRMLSMIDVVIEKPASMMVMMMMVMMVMMHLKGVLFI